MDTPALRLVAIIWVFGRFFVNFCRFLRAVSLENQGEKIHPKTHNFQQELFRVHLVARPCEFQSPCAIAIVYRLMFYMYRRVSRYTPPPPPRAS